MRSIGVIICFVSALTLDAEAFMPPNAAKRHPSTSLAVSSIASLDDTLMSIAEMSDDSQRREEFESYVRMQVKEEQMIWPTLKATDLSFARDASESLTRLGKAAQDEAWEKHVVSGFEIPEGQDSLLWRFVDMLIQFKLLLKHIEGDSKVCKLRKKCCGSCKKANKNL